MSRSRTPTTYQPPAIIHTPGHSPDSVSLVLDSGECFVGDLEPFEHLKAYEENTALKRDWERILSFHPRQIFYAHMPVRPAPFSGTRAECSRKFP